MADSANNDAITVTTSSTLVATSRPKRNFLILTNFDASADVYFAVGEAAVLSSGFKLGAGASLILSSSDLPGCNSFPIYGIVSTGTASVGISEVFTSSL